MAGSMYGEPAGDPALALAERLFGSIGALRRQSRRVAGGPWPIGKLTGAQAELVRCVRRRPGASVAEAAAELSLAANTVSTLVTQLTEAGLLRRQRDESDGRVARLYLTASAARRVALWRDRRTAVAAAAIAGLSDADRATLTAAMPVIDKLTRRLGSENPR